MWQLGSSDYSLYRPIGRFILLRQSPSLVWASNSVKTVMVNNHNMITTYNSRYRNAESSRCPLIRTAPSMYARPAFVAPNFDRFGVAMQQTIRSLQFWRKVLTIWASFKLTQASVAFQTKFRQSDWPRCAWDQQHHRAGDVSFLYPTPRYNFSTLALLHRAESLLTFIFVVSGRWCSICAHRWRSVISTRPFFLKRTHDTTVIPPLRHVRYRMHDCYSFC